MWINFKELINLKKKEKVQDITIYNEHLARLKKDQYPYESIGDMNMFKRNYLIGQDALRNNDEFFCIYGLKTVERNFPYPSDLSFWAVHNGKQQCMWFNSLKTERPQEGSICPDCKRKIILYQ